MANSLSRGERLSPENALGKAERRRRAKLAREYAHPTRGSQGLFAPSQNPANADAYHAGELGRITEEMARVGAQTRPGSVGPALAGGTPEHVSYADTAYRRNPADLTLRDLALLGADVALPVAGGLPGLLADAEYMERNPKERTVGNALLAAAGVAFPFLPGVAGMSALMGLGGDVAPARKALGPMGKELGAVPGRRTIRKAARSKDAAYPGVWKDPQTLSREAEAMVAPESNALGLLFNTSREELADIANRSGNRAAHWPGMKNSGRIANSAYNIMIPSNADRLATSLEVAKTKAPRLTEGMKGWYVMDPAYNRLVELVGEPEADRLYNQFNHLTGMSSPASGVDVEIPRGTAANVLAEQGKFEDYLRFGGNPSPHFNKELPGELAGFPGHPYHSTAQAPAMARWLETGTLPNDPKVPSYIQASSVPNLGFQTSTAVGDAHWSRAAGLADVRTAKAYGKSVSSPEMEALGPWWRNEVAGQVGYESVPGQAITWGLYAPQTGVDTAIGAPKLELLADNIMRTAKRLNIPPHLARDMVLTGRAHAGFSTPETLGLTALGAGAGAAAYYGGQAQGDNLKAKKADREKRRQNALAEALR